MNELATKDRARFFNGWRSEVSDQNARFAARYKRLHDEPDHKIHDRCHLESQLWKFSHLFAGCWSSINLPNSTIKVAPPRQRDGSIAKSTRFHARWRSLRDRPHDDIAIAKSFIKFSALGFGKWIQEISLGHSVGSSPWEESSQGSEEGNRLWLPANPVER